MLLTPILLFSLSCFYITETDGSNETSLLPDNCGISKVDVTSRIIDGEDARIGANPWAALLGVKTEDVNTSFFCGGSLISDRYIITAGHCIVGYIILKLPDPDVNELKNTSIMNKMASELAVKHGVVRLGEYDTSTDPDCDDKGNCADQYMDMDIARVALRPYRAGGGADLALIELMSPVQFTDYIQPVCLHKNGQDLPSDVTIIGWGRDYPVTWIDYLEDKHDIELNASLLVTEFPKITAEKTSSILQAVKLKLIPMDECRRQWRKIEVKVEDYHMCVAPEEWKTACTGDSGSPVQFTNAADGRIYQLGVIIKAAGPCRAYQVTIPNIVTSISYFYQWILDNIQ